jgi:cytochrome c-type biogenesis protein CcsB
MPADKLADLSLDLLVAGALTLAFAFVCDVAAVALAAQSRRVVRAAGLVPAVAGAGASGTGSATATTGSFGARGATGSAVLTTGPGTGLGSIAIGAAWGAWLFLGLSMLLRAVLVGRGPWGSMFEFGVAFGWGILSGYLFLERRYPIRAIGFVPLGVALFLVAYALTLPAQISPLVPALHNPPLLTIHVAMAVISYGIFATSFGAAVGYLAQGDDDRFAWLPPRTVLDEVAYRAVIIGFPVFATLIVLGAYWASIAWGRYWGWDPKETSALVTWLIYAAYLHARSLRGWSGRPAALLLVVGFGAVLFTYFGNLFFSGLHAYSGL